MNGESSGIWGKKPGRHRLICGQFRSQSTRVSLRSWQVGAQRRRLAPVLWARACRRPRVLGRPPPEQCAYSKGDAEWGPQGPRPRPQCQVELRCLEHWEIAPWEFKGDLGGWASDSSSSSSKNKVHLCCLFVCFGGQGSHFGQHSFCSQHLQMSFPSDSLFV